MKARLSMLYFLQFGVWGCYLTSFGQMLGAGGLGSSIAWFYAAIGIVSIVTPWFFGQLADRTGRPERLLGYCHMAAAAVMLTMWRYCMTHPQFGFPTLYPLYLLFLAFYMPTMALANTTSFALLTRYGHNTVTSFPSIRVWGTVGFVAAMWLVNCAYWTGDSLGFSISEEGSGGYVRFQYTAMQLLCSGVFGILTALYSFTLPRTAMPAGEVAKEDNPDGIRRSLAESLRLMFGRREVTVFLLFVVLAGVCLQISNGFVTPFITHFSGMPEYARSLASGNATMLFSLSQMSEAACVLLVGLMLKRKGIRTVYALGLLAWALRFGMLGLGNPGDGLWLLIGSMLVYGIAFNFITIAGHIHIQQVAPEGMKGFAQGLMMFMSNGIGATTGTLIAGGVINRWCGWRMVELPDSGAMMRLFMGDWIYPWAIFAVYAFVVMLLWLIFNRNIKPSNS